MKRFADLYFDEDVSVLLARILNGRGFGAVTVRDAGMRGKTGREQLIFATKENRTILTHNRCDFEELHSLWLQSQLEHSGIVVAGRRDVYEIARRIGGLLESVELTGFRNQVFYI